MNKKSFLPLPNKKLPSKPPNNLRAPIKTEPQHSKLLPVQSKARTTFKYASPKTIKPGYGQTITPPPPRNLQQTHQQSINVQNNTKYQPNENASHAKSTLLSNNLTSSVTSIKEMNRKPKSPKKEQKQQNQTPNPIKIEAFDDLCSDSLPEGFESFLDEIEASHSQQAKNDSEDQNIENQMGQSEIPPDNEDINNKYFLDDNDDDVGDLDLMNNQISQSIFSESSTNVSVEPTTISVSFGEENSKEMDLVMLLEENQKCNKQISANNAEINYLRDQLKSQNQKEIELKKKLTEFQNLLPQKVKEQTEKYSFELAQFKTKLNFKDEEIRSSEQKQEILNTQLHEKERMISSLQKQIDVIKQQQTQQIQQMKQQILKNTQKKEEEKKPPTPKKIKKEDDKKELTESIKSWNISTYSHRERVIH